MNGINCFWQDGNLENVSYIEKEDPKAPNWTSYKTMRDSYRKEDSEQSFSSNIQLSDKEKIISGRLERLRKQYIENHLNSKDGGLLNPSKTFCEQKEQIEKTGPFFNFFKQMPKGGHLHLHTSSSCTAKWIFDTLIKNNDASQPRYPKAYVCIEDCGDASKNEKTYIKGELAFYDGSPPKCFELLSEKHTGNDDQEDMRKYLVFDSVRVTVNTVPYIWDEFSRIFRRVSALLINKEFYLDYYTHSFILLVDDNISYLELRTGSTTFRHSSDDISFISKDLGAIDSSNLDAYLTLESVEQHNDDYIALLQNAAKQADNYAKEKNKSFTLKIILSASRKLFYKKDDKNNWIENTKGAIENAIKMKKKHDSVIGFDFVSEEDRGGRTEDLAKLILDNRYWESIDFYFHDGESNWADDDNVLDAYLLSSKRVGHGFNLFRFPKLLECYKGAAKAVDNGTIKRPICLEICPISNQMLRYTNDLRNHPAYELMKRGVQCVLASDDPQIFENHGLSYDFWAAYYWMHLSLEDIKKLVFNSIEYSGLPENETKVRVSELESQWDQFISDQMSQLKEPTNFDDGPSN